MKKSLLPKVDNFLFFRWLEFSVIRMCDVQSNIFIIHHSLFSVGTLKLWPPVFPFPDKKCPFSGNLLDIFFSILPKMASFQLSTIWWILQENTDKNKSQNSNVLVSHILCGDTLLTSFNASIKTQKGLPINSIEEVIFWEYSNSLTLRLLFEISPVTSLSSPLMVCLQRPTSSSPPSQSTKDTDQSHSSWKDSQLDLGRSSWQPCLNLKLTKIQWGESKYTLCKSLNLWYRSLKCDMCS